MGSEMCIRDSPNGEGETISRKDYEGRPLVLLFYLGHGCLHCAEQLEKFAQNAELFEKAGFEVVVSHASD